MSENLKKLHRSIFILSLIALLLAVTLTISLAYVYRLTFNEENTNTTVAIAAKKPPSAKTTLSFNPSFLTLSQNKEGFVNLTIQSANRVSGAEFTVKFDPAVLEIVSASPAGFFEKPNILAKKMDNQKGTLYFAIGTFTPKAGSGNLVTLVVKGKNSGTSYLKLAPDTKVAASGENDNVLKMQEEAQITVLP